jgi:tetratricopeptide (TPR) repeat protein
VHDSVDTARRSGDPVALCQTLAQCQHVISGPSTLAQRIEWSAEMRHISDQAGDPTLRVWVAYRRLIDALVEANLPVFRSSAATIDEVMEQVPSAFWRWTHQHLAALRAILAGELDDAERLAAAAWAYGEQAGQSTAATLYGMQIGILRAHQGRLHELRPGIERSLSASGGLPAQRAVLAHACARGEDLGRAADLLDEDRAGGLAMPEDAAWLTGHAAWVCAAVLVGDLAGADELYERLRPFHDQLASAAPVTVNCAVAHYLGMVDHLLGRHDEADGWYERAMAIHHRMESPLLIAYTDAAWAALLADRDRGDDRERARAMAERAVEVSAARGLGYIHADAQAVLARLQGLQSLRAR